MRCCLHALQALLKQLIFNMYMYGCSSNLEWGCDDLTLYYTRPDENNRPFALLLHKTCQSVLSDIVLHEEKDERFVTLFTSHLQLYLE